MNKKIAIGLWIIAFFCGVMAVKAAWVPANINRDPATAIASLDYGYDSNGAVGRPLAVDGSGKLITSSSSVISGSVSVSNFNPTPSGGALGQAYAASPTPGINVGAVVLNFSLTATYTPTPVFVRITNRTFTTAQSATPTPIVTAVSGQFNHIQMYFANTGTAGDTFTVYMGSTALPIYLAPAGGYMLKSFIDTASNIAVSVAGPVTNAGCTITGWGLLDQQPYQVPINLTAP